MKKSKLRRRSRSIKTGATPTPERRLQYGGMVQETIEWGGNGRALVTRYRARWITPIDAYRQLKFLSEPEYMAGKRFNDAYYKAVRSKGAAIERLRKLPTKDKLTVAERIVRDALKVLAPETKRALVDICGHDEPAQDDHKLNKLKSGLGQLALHWKLAAIEVCQPCPKYLSSRWHKSPYRRGRTVRV